MSNNGQEMEPYKSRNDTQKKSKRNPNESRRGPQSTSSSYVANSPGVMRLQQSYIESPCGTAYLKGGPDDEKERARKPRRRKGTREVTVKYLMKYDLIDILDDKEAILDFQSAMGSRQSFQYVFEGVRDKIPKNLCEMWIELLVTMEERADVNKQEVSRAERCSDVNTEEVSRTERCSDVSKEQVSQTERCSDVNTEEVSRTERCSDVSTEEVSRAERCSDVNTEEVSRTERCSDVSKEQVSQTERCSDVNTEEVSRTERCSDVSTEEVSQTESCSDVNRTESASSKLAFRKREIRMRDMIRTMPGQEKPVRTLLTIGGAGIGKTVFTKKYVLNWAREADKRHELKILIPFYLRDFNLIVKKTVTFREVIHMFFKELEGFNDFNTNQVMFILDGLEEFMYRLDFENNEVLTDINKPAPITVMLTSLINGHLLPLARIWITARPATAKRIPALERFDRVTELRGFTKPNREVYFKKRYSSDEDLASRMISHIRTSVSLQTMCHLPVFCWMTSTVLEHYFREDIENEHSLPITAIEMYMHFLAIESKMVYAG